MSGFYRTRLYMACASLMLQHHVHNGVHGAAAAREVLVAQSKAHLDLLEGQRKLFLRSRALSLAQRALLYAHDELDMSMMRMQLRSAHDVVKLHEQHFRLQPAEVPLKNRVSPSRPTLLHSPRYCLTITLPASCSGKCPSCGSYVVHCVSIHTAMRQHYSFHTGCLLQCWITSYQAQLIDTKQFLLQYMRIG